MIKKEEIKAVYQKGYSEGFADACNLMRESTMDLAKSMYETLATSTQVFEELEGLK